MYLHKRSEVLTTVLLAVEVYRKLSLVVCKQSVTFGWNQNHTKKAAHKFILKLFFLHFSDRASQYIYLSINQLDAQNLFHSKFYFMPPHVSSTCAHHQEVKIALHTYRCDDIRDCVMQF